MLAYTSNTNKVVEKKVNAAEYECGKQWIVIHPILAAELFG